MDKKEVTRPKNWFESLNYAIEGVIYAFKTQKHIRYHYLIAAAALFLSLFLDLPMSEFVLFTMAVLFLLFAEMVNTALEEIVNLVEEKHHMTAKNAKDVAAGAVLIASVGVAVMVYSIFSKYLHEPIGVAIREAREFSVHIAVISLLLVLISVVCLKALTRRGRPLHGGMPSGHAAVAFSIFTSITVLTLDATVAILAFALAFMVSHSRLLGGIHSKVEILLGGLLGFGLTLLIFWVFFRALQ